MSAELESAAVDGVGGFWRRRKTHDAPVVGDCANCGAALLGPWCHACGQSHEDFHRSSIRLIGEVFEGLLHFDGRLWKTLPALFRRPGSLTRRYLDGHRASQIPPLRLFLVVLLLVFVAGALGSPRPEPSKVTETIDAKGNHTIERRQSFETMTPAERTQIKAVLNKADVRINSLDGTDMAQWFKDRLFKAIDDPERFKLVLEQWGERFAFLSLPLAAGLLSLLFVFQRRFYVFDHVIFSLHSLSALGLVTALVLGLNRVTHGDSKALWLIMPFHLFFHMRGVYQTSRFGTLARMFLLFVGSLTGAGLLVVGLFWVGLNGMGG